MAGLYAPYRRFAAILAEDCARIGGDVGCYSFIAVDSHHILLAGLPAHSLALRPAHSRGHQFVTPSEGFRHFVSSMPAPVASGWSESPGGTCTHWKAPPFHGAHPKQSFGAIGHDGESCPTPAVVPHLPFAIPVRIGAVGGEVLSLLEKGLGCTLA
jgi:hypothetical protein